MSSRCGVAALLGAAGPARIPLRMCCVTALIERRTPEAAREFCPARASVSAAPFPSSSGTGGFDPLAEPDVDVSAAALFEFDALDLEPEAVP